MSFLVPLALALGLAIAFPILAHALRKGQAKPVFFPAARLVPEHKSTARQRHRIEDRLLLLLRILMILCLALLAASPFVQCARLSLSRTDGASVAAALVIDDSASMRAELPGGGTRLEAALRGAEQLLETARPGDSFSIILAGYPARVLTPSTTELGSILEALETITPSDRPTDLNAALNLARSLQADLPQTDRPIVLLSDLSVTESVDLSDVVLPDAGLRTPLENCALLNAIRTNDAVQVEVACTSAEALKGRLVQLQNEKGESVATPQPARDGAVRVPIEKKAQKASPAPRLTALLTSAGEEKSDAIPADDECAVLDSAAALSVAVRADQGKAGHKTGAGTVVQAALEALERGVRVQTINLLPDGAKDLEPYGALFIDDPSGFTPETSDAIASWVKKGGVGVVLLGPSIENTPLGSTFSPFLEGPVKWDRGEAKGADAKVPGSLGPLTTTWADLGATKRAVFEPEEAMEVKAKWDDGSPLVVERHLGRGLLLSVGLPASVDRSDLALRPAFLELMDYAVGQSAIRRGAQATPVGDRWTVDEAVIVRGPDGKQLRRLRRGGGETGAPVEEYVEPDVAGRYTLSSPTKGEGEGPSIRVAMRDRAEHVLSPNESLSGGGGTQQAAALTKVGISREIALLALLLSVLELAFRAFKRARGARPLPSAVS